MKCDRWRGTAVAPHASMTHLRRIISIALFAGGAAALAGCSGGVGYTATATTSSYKPYGDAYYGEAYAQPTMVPVSENVWVVEGRSRPVFFSAGAYWRYDDGTWYRSSYVNDGYVRVRTVPPYLRQIHRPTRYIRYRAPERSRVRVVPPSDYRGTVRVRRPGDRYDDRYDRRDRRYRGGDRYDRRYDRRDDRRHQRRYDRRY